MMKMKLIYIFLFIFLKLNAQPTGYNVFEVDKGEILKKDYQYLEYLFDNLLVAVSLKNGVTDYNDENITGIIDLSENIVTPFQYKNISKIRDDYGLNNRNIPLIHISNGKGMALFMLKNRILKQITEFEYLKFRPFLFDGNYLSAYNGYCQIINLQSGNLIKTNFVEVEPLVNNLIATKDMDYKWGILNNNGEILIKNQFDRIRKISDSLVIIEKKDSIGVIDNKGNIVISPIFRRIDTSKNLILTQTFNTGKNLEINDMVKKKMSDYTVSVYKDSKVISKFYSINDRNIKQVGLFGAFNNKGELKIPFEYDLLQKGIDSEIIASKNGKFGIISDSGTTVLDLKYDDIVVFFDKFYLLKSKDKFGVFAKKNKKLLEVKFAKVFPISANKILYTENNVWYKVSYTNNFLNKKIQKIELNPNFRLEYIGKQLDIGIEPDFFSLECNNLYGVIDKNLNIIIPPINEKKEMYYNGKYFDGSGKIYSSKGILLKNIDVSRNYYDDDDKFKNTIICTKDGKYGVVNIYGKIVVPFKYSYIQNIDGNKFIVKE